GNGNGEESHARRDLHPSQIAQETDRHALHLAEVLKMAMGQGSNGPREAYPERRMIEPRRRAQRRSMTRAGLVTGAILAGLAVAARALASRLALRKPWYERGLERLLLDEKS
ncbi:MAG: hypothetical protein ACMG6S_05265, partial [Byssovorax sp.]